MKEIWKYSIPMTDQIELDMPEGAQILSFHTQKGNPCIWALVDPKNDLTKRHFRLAGTGHLIKDASSLRFIGTILIAGDSLVFHLFEKQ